ncbi:MAG: proline dehydrogenase family protein [Vicinamibacterales bacterium]
MSVARSILLAISDNRWMREHGTKAPFVRRAVSVFMPGETPAEMLAAAETQAALGIGAVFTRLGENVTDLAEAEAVRDHYLQVIGDVQRRGLTCEPSIKLTQLGLDVDPEAAYRNALAIGRRAMETGSYFWVDMEQSSYVDVTLDMVSRLRQDVPRIGVALQAYLYRTKDDAARMIAEGIGIRLVKGAYREPESVAFPKKPDVDANYVALAKTMMAPASRAHRLTRRVRHARHRHHQRARAAWRRPGHSRHRLRSAHAVWIQRAEQRRLARDRKNVCVLIAYGAYWFPWYMRRLAERPANVWFVVKSLFG